jgi:ABC-type taurine transport system ATPase subunit
MIEVDRLTKRFGAVTAVDALSFTVRPGHVTGFLGPNGAGKTTTMRLILGLDAPTSGTATIHQRLYKELVRPLHQVGALLDATALHPGRTAEAHLASIARSNGIGGRRVTEMLQLTGAVTLAAGELAAFVSFFGAQAALSGHHLGVSLARPGVVGAVLADGLLLFVVAMMGVGLGAIVRHTAGGIAALVGLIFLPAIAGLLPSPWGGRVGRFTLLQAAHQVTALHPATNLFAPAASLLVLLAWPAVTLLAAALTITRRDA